MTQFKTLAVFFLLLALFSLPRAIFAQNEEAPATDSVDANEDTSAEATQTDSADVDKNASTEATEKAEPSEEDKAIAKEHFIRGQEYFADEDYEGATREFKEAYKLSSNYLLLYNLGFTFDKLGNSELALFYYEKFFWTKASEGQQSEFVVKRIRELRRESTGRKALAEEQIWAAKADESGGANGSFLHQEIEEIPPGKPADVTAIAPPWRNWRLKLFYRSAGESEFTSVEMRRRYKELVGRIPASETAAAGTMQYYIEVRNRDGELVEKSGEASSPHLVFVEPTAKAIFYPDWDDRADWSSDPADFLAAGKIPEVKKKRFQVAKWSTTGAAVGLLALSMTFHAVAQDAAKEIERQAVLGSNEQCDEGPPCRSFSSRQRQLERRGNGFQAASRVSLGLGIASAATAGALWAWELTSSGNAEGRPKAAPVVTESYVGAAASWSF